MLGMIYLAMSRIRLESILIFPLTSCWQEGKSSDGASGQALYMAFSPYLM